MQFSTIGDHAQLRDVLKNYANRTSAKEFKKGFSDTYGRMFIAGYSVHECIVLEALLLYNTVAMLQYLRTQWTWRPGAGVWLQSAEKLQETERAIVRDYETRRSEWRARTMLPLVEYKGTWQNYVCHTACKELDRTRSVLLGDRRLYRVLKTFLGLSDQKSNSASGFIVRSDILKTSADLTESPRHALNVKLADIIRNPRLVASLVAYHPAMHNTADATQTTQQCYTYIPGMSNSIRTLLQANLGVRPQRQPEFDGGESASDFVLRTTGGPRAQRLRTAKDVVQAIETQIERLLPSEKDKRNAVLQQMSPESRDDVDAWKYWSVLLPLMGYIAGSEPDTVGAKGIVHAQFELLSTVTYERDQWLELYYKCAVTTQCVSMILGHVLDMIPDLSNSTNKRQQLQVPRAWYDVTRGVVVQTMKLCNKINAEISNIPSKLMGWSAHIPAQPWERFVVENIVQLHKAFNVLMVDPDHAIHWQWMRAVQKKANLMDQFYALFPALKAHERTQYMLPAEPTVSRIGMDRYPGAPCDPRYLVDDTWRFRVAEMMFMVPRYRPDNPHMGSWVLVDLFWGTGDIALLLLLLHRTSALLNVGGGSSSSSSAPPTVADKTVADALMAFARTRPFMMLSDDPREDGTWDTHAMVQMRFDTKTGVFHNTSLAVVDALAIRCYNTCAYVRAYNAARVICAVARYNSTKAHKNTTEMFSLGFATPRNARRTLVDGGGAGHLIPKDQYNYQRTEHHPAAVHHWGLLLAKRHLLVEEAAADRASTTPTAGAIQVTGNAQVSMSLDARRDEWSFFSSHTHGIAPVSTRTIEARLWSESLVQPCAPFLQRRVDLYAVLVNDCTLSLVDRTLKVSRPYQIADVARLCGAGDTVQLLTLEGHACTCASAVCYAHNLHTSLATETGQRPPTIVPIGEAVCDSTLRLQFVWAVYERHVSYGTGDAAQMHLPDMFSSKVDGVRDPIVGFSSFVDVSVPERTHVFFRSLV